MSTKLRLAMIRKGQDNQGPYLQLLVEGERFPRVFFAPIAVCDAVSQVEADGIEVGGQTPYQDFTSTSPAMTEHGMIDGRRQFMFDKEKGEVHESEAA